jgi:hypothetical protein
MKRIAKNSMNSAKRTNAIQWLVGIVVSLLAAGGGIVALCSYFFPKQPGSTASITLTASTSSTTPITDPRLRQFIEDYIVSGNYNTPEVEVGFLADPMIDYFGKRNVSHADVLADRQQYIRDWPERRYSLQAPPQLLGKEHQDVFVVLAVLQYEVRNDQTNPPKRRSGLSRSIYRIKSVGNGFKIISALEGKQE